MTTLPAYEPIDITHGGTLTIDPVMLGHLLRLPAGQEVMSARIDACGRIELLVCGAGLPPRSPSCIPAILTLLFRREVRDGVRSGAKEWRTLASWSHDPDRKWAVSDWGSDG